MYFSEEEKRVLGGESGPLKQKTLDFIVKYANVLGAERLCKVSKAHLFCGAHHYLEAVRSKDMDEIMSEMWFCSSEKIPFDAVGCFSQSDCSPVDHLNWSKMGCRGDEFRKNERYLDRCLKAGVHLVGSCVPYMTGFIPLFGEHYVTTESHAVLMMNSLWGACANADGIEAAFCSAVCTRTPLWGMHLPESRKGTHLFDVTCKPETVEEWDLLGYSIGLKLPPHSIPILTGNVERADMLRLKSCFASLATTSGPELCHIIGATPEASSLQACLSPSGLKDQIEIGPRQLNEAREILCDQEAGEVDYVSLGCPHYSIDQISAVAGFLNGCKVKAGVTLHVWTALPIKAVADRCGYTKTIEDAGGVLMVGSCPLVSEKWPAGTRAMAFDSAKQAHYIKPLTKTKVFFGNWEECLQASISGTWGRWSTWIQL
ncbi:MAG: aconitase X catalytic domain-containing protein [Thermovirgaceae bacterium]|nr:aconitase X catalytic domain-containing protein [Thermovirgaceae bacterium]